MYQPSDDDSQTETDLYSVLSNIIILLDARRPPGENSSRLYLSRGVWLPSCRAARGGEGVESCTEQQVEEAGPQGRWDVVTGGATPPQLTGGWLALALAVAGHWGRSPPCTVWWCSTLKWQGSRTCGREGGGGLTHSLLCVFRLQLWENDLRHWLQGRGFSPVCVLLCFFRWPPSENGLGHWSQEEGFSPVCFLLCFFRLPSWENDLGHRSQGKRFSPVWFFKMIFFKFKYWHFKIEITNTDSTRVRWPSLLVEKPLFHCYLGIGTLTVTQSRYPGSVIWA